MKRGFLKIICITVAAMCILGGCSSTSEKEDVSTSSASPQASYEDSDYLVFDCTKLIKAKKDDTDLDSEKNSKETAASDLRSERKNAGIVYDSNKSELYNDYRYEISNISVRGDALINSRDISIAESTYSKYNDIINRLWGSLKSQLSESEYDALYKEQKNWLDEKMTKYPTCDDSDGKFEDKIGAIQMTDERITVLLNYLK